MNNSNQSTYDPSNDKTNQNQAPAGTNYHSNAASNAKSKQSFQQSTKEQTEITDSQYPIAASSSRQAYKTYILSNGIFEVENRYVIREVIGQGAYGEYGYTNTTYDIKWD